MKCIDFWPNQVNGSQIRPSGWNNILGGRWWYCIVFNRCISWIYGMEWELWIGLIGVSHAKWRRHKSTSDLQNKITKQQQQKKVKIHWVISVFVSGCFENIKESFFFFDFCYCSVKWVRFWILSLIAIIKP